MGRPPGSKNKKSELKKIDPVIKEQMFNTFCEWINNLHLDPNAADDDIYVIEIYMAYTGMNTDSYPTISKKEIKEYQNALS